MNQEALYLDESSIHEVNTRERAFIFHIPSSGLFEPDLVTGDILRRLRNEPSVTRSRLVSELGTNYGVEEIDTAIEELEFLGVITGFKPHQVAPSPIHLEKVPLTTMVLNVNTGCNLSCSYCYKEDLQKPSAGKEMTFETAKQSIDMLLTESPDIDRYNLVFFGGEPLTNFSLITNIIEYTERLFQSAGKKIDFSLTTNATLLTESTIEYLDDHAVGIAVSMDGPRAFHDRNRITIGGKGTYDVVRKKVDLLLARYKSRPVGVRVTLTHGILDVERIWDHLFNTIGFAEVGFAPVTSGDTTAFNLVEEELIQLYANMKDLGQLYLSEALKGRNIGFSNLHQLLTDLHEGRKKKLPCGAGVGMVAVDNEGGVNLCHRFTGSDQPLMGHVERGMDIAALNTFLNQRQNHLAARCATCRIRNLCAGGCYHESYTRVGDASEPTSHYCDLMRNWIDFGIEVYTEIMQSNPAYYTNFIEPRSCRI